MRSTQAHDTHKQPERSQGQSWNAKWAQRKTRLFKEICQKTQNKPWQPIVGIMLVRLRASNPHIDCLSSARTTYIHPRLRQMWTWILSQFWPKLVLRWSTSPREWHNIASIEHGPTITWAQHEGQGRNHLYTNQTDISLRNICSRVFACAQHGPLGAVSSLHSLHLSSTWTIGAKSLHLKI